MPHSHLYGGHAIVAAGYDDSISINGDKGALLIRNSWGTGWGESGYGRIEYGCSNVGYAACYVDYSGTSILTDSDAVAITDDVVKGAAGGDQPGHVAE